MYRSFLFLLLFSIFFFETATAQQDSLVDILAEELEREFEVLSKADVAAYYMDYSVNELSTTSINANLGSLILSNQNKARIARVTVRVGDYDKDNTHKIFDRESVNSNANSTSIALTNSKKSIQKSLWQITHAAYIASVNQFKNVQNLEDEDDDSELIIADFSKEKPTISIEAPLTPSNKIDQAAWDEKLKKISKKFNGDPDILSGKLNLNYTLERKYFTSSEKTKIAQNMTFAHLNVSSSVRCFDGEIVPIYKSYFAFNINDLPTEEELSNDVDEMIETLHKLKNAPLAEPFTGPALLHARVAGVFFHEIFGHRIEGHRLKSKNDGQTFKGKINEKILPQSINIFSDPSLKQYDGQDLIGSYKFDDEGIAGRKVQVVEKGVLRSFLMSRSPLEKFNQSNGHGRCQAGLNPVSRQSNLIIESLKPLSDKKLRKMLIQECEKQGVEYGYYFVDVTGGFTRTDRYNTNSFNIKPTLVYKIYVDGKPDELVRGVDLIGTPLAMFAQIDATGDEKETFTGICGAESGGVPVSATAPALFVKRIETQKKPSGIETDIPLIPAPAPK